MTIRPIPTPATGDAPTFSVDQLREMLANAEQQQHEQQQQQQATNAVQSRIADMLADVASLARAANLSGLDVNAVATFQSALTRATPVTPDVLANVIDPPAPTVVTRGRRASSTTTEPGERRTRRTPSRDLSRVANGSVWLARADARDGSQYRGHVIVRHVDGHLTFTVARRDGSRWVPAGETFSTPTPAVQSATGRNVPLNGYRHLYAVTGGARMLDVLADD